MTIELEAMLFPTNFRIKQVFWIPKNEFGKSTEVFKKSSFEARILEMKSKIDLLSIILKN